jgi:hypothetical protein
MYVRSSAGLTTHLLYWDGFASVVPRDPGAREEALSQDLTERDLILRVIS